MILNALKALPGQSGTKDEILAKVSDLYQINLSSRENSALSKTLLQSFSKYFGKTAAPQEYRLNTAEFDFTNFNMTQK